MAINAFIMISYAPHKTETNFVFANCSVFRKQQKSKKCRIGNNMFGDDSPMLDLPSTGTTYTDVTKITIKTSDEDHTHDTISLIKEDLTPM